MEKGDEAQEWQGGKGMGGKGTDVEKGYKKRITIFLFTRAMPGTPASILYFGTHSKKCLFRYYFITFIALSFFFKLKKIKCRV